jgi:cell fate regulator YaaT (PSP1 superfamily)
MTKPVLVRYGAISEVARFVNASGASLPRGARVVIKSHRGLESGLLLEDAPFENHTAQHNVAESSEDLAQILRAMTDDDHCAGQRLKSECEDEYARWQARIQEWNLQLELIDLEWTLDRSKIILYVLNDRGPECTRLALQAAAAGLGVVEVQSVGPDGLVPADGGHGCGSGHCGSGHSDSGGGSNGCCH